MSLKLSFKEGVMPKSLKSLFDVKYDDSPFLKYIYIHDLKSQHVFFCQINLNN